MKYYDGQEVKVGDYFQGNYVGTNKVVEILQDGEDKVALVKNVSRLELVELHEDCFGNYDLLQRAEDAKGVM
jgi:hypothetical protein